VHGLVLALGKVLAWRLLLLGEPSLRKQLLEMLIFHLELVEVLKHLLI